jgi:hypothetical protein
MRRVISQTATLFRSIAGYIDIRRHENKHIAAKRQREGRGT